MKKTYYLIKTFVLALLITTTACNSDDDNNQATTPTLISIQDLDVAIDENPTNGQVIGTIQTNSTTPLAYTITTEAPTGALAIDVNTGEITVADVSLFNYELNTVITATVSATNAQNIATVTINLNDVAESSTVGEFRDGGIVFWVDPTDDTHGLICAPSDNSIGVTWGSNAISVPIANDASIGSGAANTAAIVAANSAITTAADVATNASINGFNDWFLPSRDELYEIYLNQTIINTTALANGGASLGSTLWSSTQFNNSASTAYFLGVSNGSLNGTGKTAALDFRVVRAF